MFSFDFDLCVVAGGGCLTLMDIYVHLVMFSLACDWPFYSLECPNEVLQTKKKKKMYRLFKQDVFPIQLIGNTLWLINVKC